MLRTRPWTGDWSCGLTAWGERGVTFVADSTARDLCDHSFVRPFLLVISMAILDVHQHTGYPRFLPAAKGVSSPPSPRAAQGRLRSAVPARKENIRYRVVEGKTELAQYGKLLIGELAKAIKLLIWWRRCQIYFSRIAEGTNSGIVCGQLTGPENISTSASFQHRPG